MKTVTELIRYADASGHEHEPAGRPEGGQFAKSAHELASSLPAGKRGGEKKGVAETTVSRDDMINFLVDHGQLPADENVIDAMNDQQIAEVFAKANAPQEKAPESNQPRTQKLGVMGKPVEPGAIAGRFDRNNLPKVGDTIAYYDGEGGFSGTKAKEQVGKVLAVSTGTSRGIQVVARTGHKVWIDNEAARPA